MSPQHIAKRLQGLLDGARVHWSPAAGQAQRSLILGAQDSFLIQAAINRLLITPDTAELCRPFEPVQLDTERQA